MPSPVITVAGVSKAFPGVRALNDVRFELMTDEVHALIERVMQLATQRETMAA